MGKIILKIGTRTSKLAIKQTRFFIKALDKAGLGGAFKCQIVPIKTSGDDRLEGAIPEKFGVKGLFTNELHLALQDGRIDCAVHSVKDLPCEKSPGIEIVSVLKRCTAHDGFFSNTYKNLNSVPSGGKIGTSSIRRKMFLQKIRPDLEIIPLRGNVNSRIEKMKNLNIDGIILSYCAIKRMKYFRHIKYSHKICDSNFPPAIGQGIIGIETLDNASEIIKKAIQKTCHKTSFFEANIERKFAAMLDSSCQTPISCNAKKMQNSQVKIKIGFVNTTTFDSIFTEKICNIHSADQAILDLVNYVKKIKT